MKRSESREIVFKVLFQREYHEDFNEIYDRLLGELDAPTLETSYAKKTMVEILENITTIDGIINDNLKGWVFERLSKTVIAILRLGIYEIIYSDTIPNVAAINEAMKIAYQYCDEKECVFINGILHAVHSKDTSDKSDSEDTGSDISASKDTDDDIRD